MLEWKILFNGAFISYLIKFLYLFLLVYNPIHSYLPFGNYADELLCIMLASCAFIKLGRNNFIIKKDDGSKTLILCILIAVIGFFSNAIYNYASSLSAIVRDTLNTFKFFLTFYCGEYIFENYKSEKLTKSIIKISKIFIVVIFVFAVVSAFVYIGMGADIRYGIRCYKFIYSHYTYLVFNEALLITAIMCEKKKNHLYYIMSGITLLLTLRTKAFLFIGMVLFFLLVFHLHKNNVRFSSVLKLRYVIPIGIMSYFIVKDKVAEYIEWGINQSIRVGIHYEGIKLMISHFPLGTGFGTYGTNLSFKENSAVYNLNSSLNYSKLMDYGYATISDVYWPSIYTQFGIFGFIAFVIAIVICVKHILNDKNNSERVKLGRICLMFYLILSSGAEAVFSNETGVFAPIFMIILNCLIVSETNSEE
ncbi:MAG: hypothetical protein IJZ64_03745 [Ruminococcus sp.]|nr:hypothetical protein [Ruminococcus sp.]